MGAVEPRRVPLRGAGRHRADLTGCDPGRAGPGVTSTTVILIGSAILIALLQAIFAAGLRSGRGGARAALILLTALAALHLLFAVHVLSPVSRIVQLLGLAVAAAATVAMLLPGTYAWFARPRR